MAVVYDLVMWPVGMDVIEGMTNYTNSYYISVTI